MRPTEALDALERPAPSRRQLEDALEAMPVAAVLCVPGDGRVVHANRAFVDLTGLEPELVTGAAPPYPWAATDVSWHPLDGDDDPLLLGVFPIPAGPPQFDPRLVQSGKLAAVGELAAGVAHEINNPLFAILGLTEFLLKEAAPGTQPYERLSLIQETGLEIKEIVRALLDFARENADVRHVIELEDVVRSTLDLVRRTNAHKGIELIDSYDAPGVEVHASANQLKQIVLNLIANARQAMPNGGTVRVSVRRERDQVLVVVADDGPGVSPDVLDRIFEPFFTTKRDTGGTGLGLSVGLGIAESHGGSLSVLSHPGAGATFTLRLPVIGGGT